MNLPKLVTYERSILGKAESVGGILLRLRQLFKALVNSKETAAHMDELGGELEWITLEWHKNRKASEEWVVACLEKLKTSQWVKHPLVTKVIRDSEALILEKHFDPSSFPLKKDHLEWCLSILNPCSLNIVADVIAQFGETAIFEGWADLDYRSIPAGDIKVIPNTLVFKSIILDSRAIQNAFRSLHDLKSTQVKWGNVVPSVEREGIRSIRGRGFQDRKMHNDRKIGYSLICGWFDLPNDLVADISKQLGCGVFRCEVEPCQVFNHENGTKKVWLNIFLHTGCFMGFRFPEYVQKMLPIKKQEEARRQEMHESDPAALFGYLQFLSKYEAAKCVTLPSENDITSWEELREFNKEASLGFYFSKFSSADGKRYPVSREALLKLIDRFLDMVSCELEKDNLLKGPARKKFVSAKAKAFSIQVLMNHVCRLNVSERQCFKSANAYEFVKTHEALCHRTEEFNKSLTHTMILEDAIPEAKKKLRELGIIWAPIGGAPPKNK